MAALGAAALVVACAGELDQPPENFTKAFNDGTGGSTTTGGSSTGGGISTGGAGGTSSTGGSATGGGGAVPPDDACVAAVFSAKGCSTSCHNKDTISIPALSAGLALDGANLGARLSMTKATYASVTKNPTACVQGALIIDPVTPANSILLKKVTATQACGDPMPQGGVGLTGTDLQCITDWINKF